MQNHWYNIYRYNRIRLLCTEPCVSLYHNRGCEGGYRLHQKEYLESKLRQRKVLHGRASLPEIEEGNAPPVEQEVRESMEYKSMLKKAQEEVGSLQWLALKTRPYIAAITAGCASTHSRNPWKAVWWAPEGWKYLKATTQLGMELVP